MITLSLVSAALLAAMLGVALWNLVAAPRLERAAPPAEPTRISLLVPARNEAENLRVTLPAMLRLEHPDLEILVLDDGSTDDTAAVAEAHREGAGHPVRVLSGLPLPAGWLGKSWACHQLAEAARGEILVFCDADVTPRADGLLRTEGAMRTARAGAVTALPGQHLHGWQARSVVPLIAQLPVLALLPLPLVPTTRAPSLSMANGQWLAFTREAYRACGGHAAVRSDVLEDVALGRRVKEAGQRLLAVVAREALSVRMYRDGRSLREGFAKNLYALAGGRPLPFAIAAVAFGLTAVYPWLGAMAGVPAATLPLGLLVAVRLCGVALFRHGLVSVLLHPPGSLLVLAIAAASFRGARAGRLRWKGRPIGQGAASPVAWRRRPASRGGSP